MPMITGQKPIRKSKQGRFQIVDTIEIMRPLTKYARQVVSGSAVAATVREAFRVAEEERPGAVHIELPEDVAADDASGEPFTAARVRRPDADEKAVATAVGMIEEAKSPLILIGAGANRKLTSAILRDPRVKAATLTGSEKAGASVASICGQEIKTTVLELGGSDPYVVFEDADVEAAARVAVEARLQNAGQSCIAAKRFVVVRAVHDRFVALLKEGFAKVVMGHPLDEKTTMGPLASESGLRDIARQVEDSVAMGAKLVCGGRRADGPGWFYEPTILTGVRKGMPACDEETFGPAAAVIEAANEEEAIAIANDTEFGLGASLWTKDVAKAKRLAARLNAGFVAINNMVTTDPRLPFGGIGKSGYGRELSHYGIKEFVNVKTVRNA